MNREVMGRQMFRNGGAAFPDLSGDGQVTQKDILMGRGVIPMKDGGVVEEFSAVFASGDTDAFMDFFVENEAQLRREARQNPSLANMIKLIDTMEAQEADRDIAQTQSMPLTPSPRPPMEVAAPGGSTYIPDPRAFGGEQLQPGVPYEDLGTLFPGGTESAPQPDLNNYTGIQDFAVGGVAAPAPMAAAPGPEAMPPVPNQAELEAMPIEGVAQQASQLGVDPSAIEAMLGEVSNNLGNLENAESYEEVINSIREADAPIEVRYKELADLVGEEDAMQTPESVLTLVQPIVMMSGIDQGIGALASEEMTAPVTGNMAEGIMSTVNMGTEEVPPVNFNQGGAVQYFAPENANRVAGAMPGGRLGQLYGEKRDLYRSIMGKEDQQAAYDEQKDLTQAQMLFDIAQGALGFAAGSGMPGRSPAEQLAAAASPVLGNISQRAGELSKFKQAQAKEARAMDIAALTAAEGALTAELKAAADIEKQKKAGAIKMAELRLDDKLKSARSRAEEDQKQKGRTELENLKLNNQKSLEETLQANRQALKRLEGQNSREDIILADKLRRQNAQLNHELELNKMGVANTYELEKLDKLHEQSTELQKSRLGLQEAIAKNRLEFDKEQAKLTNARDDEKVKIQKRLAELKERDTKLKESAAKIDLFGKGLQGKVKNILEGQGSAALADKYANNLTSPDETNMIEGAINYHTNDQKVWNSETARYDRVGANKLIDAWGEALKKRSTFEGASMPSVGEDEAKRLNLGAFAPPPAGGATPPAAGSDRIPEKGDTYKSLLGELQDAMEDVAGRGAAIQSIINRGSELVIGQPLFEGAAEAQDLLRGINSATVNSIAKALPGKESDQWRAEMARQMPPVAEFTSGPKTALNKTKGFIAYLNTEIDAMNERLASPKPEGDIGELRQAASVLESYRNVYVKIRKKLDAAIRGSSSPELGEKKRSLDQFVKDPEKLKILQGGMK